MATFRWRGEQHGHGQSGDWNAPADWATPGGPPGPDDTALFRGGAGANFVTGGGTIDRLISLRNGVEFDGNLTLLGQSGPALSMTGSSNSFGGRVTAPEVVIRGTQALGTFAEFGGTLTAGRVAIGGHSPFPDFGSEVLFDGRENTRHLSLTPAAGSSATLEIFAGGTWDNSRSVIVGGAGSGVLSVEWGAARIGYQGERGNLILGSRAGGSGTADVATVLQVANRMLVGDGGTGALIVEQGGSVHAGGLVVEGGSAVTLGGFQEHFRYIAELTMGSGTIEAGGTLQGAGETTARRGIDNQGAIAATGYLRIAGDVSDSGSMAIGDGAVIHITGDVLGHGTIAFAQAGDAALVIGAGAVIDPTLTGFAAGDAIRARGIDGLRFDAASGHLALLSDGTLETTLILAGSYAAAGFHLAVAHGQGIVTYAAPSAHGF